MNYVIQHLRHVVKNETLEDGSSEFSATNEVAYVMPNDVQKFSRKPFRSSKYLSRARLYSTPETAIRDAQRFIRYDGMDPRDVKILQVEHTVRFPKDNMNEAVVFGPVVVGSEDKIYPVEKTLLYKYGDLRAKDDNVFYTIIVSRPNYAPWYVVPGSDIRDDFFQYNGHVLNAIKFSTKEMAVEALNFYINESNGSYLKAMKRYGYEVGVVSVAISGVVVYPNKGPWQQEPQLPVVKQEA